MGDFFLSVLSRGNVSPHKHGKNFFHFYKAGGTKKRDFLLFRGGIFVNYLAKEDDEKQERPIFSSFCVRPLRPEFLKKIL